MLRPEQQQRLDQHRSSQCTRLVYVRFLLLFVRYLPADFLSSPHLTPNNTTPPSTFCIILSECGPGQLSLVRARACTLRFACTRAPVITERVASRASKPIKEFLRAPPENHAHSSSCSLKKKCIYFLNDHYYLIFYFIFTFHFRSGPSAAKSRLKPARFRRGGGGGRGWGVLKQRVGVVEVGWGRGWFIFFLP